MVENLASGDLGESLANYDAVPYGHLDDRAGEPHELVGLDHVRSLHPTNREYLLCRRTPTWPGALGLSRYITPPGTTIDGYVGLSTIEPFTCPRALGA